MAENTGPPNLGEVLRAWRSVRDLGVREAAKRFGLSAATFNRIERGKSCDMRVLLKLMNALFGNLQASKGP